MKIYNSLILVWCLVVFSFRSKHNDCSLNNTCTVLSQYFHAIRIILIRKNILHPTSFRVMDEKKFDETKRAGTEQNEIK
jgi:hypothetical protein